MAVINGTNGNDTLVGTLSSDIINGYDGDDIIYGGSGNDSMYGDDGDDVFLLDGSAGTDYYYGGNGYDSIVVSNVQSAFSYVDIGVGSLNSIEAIINYDWKPAYVVTTGVLDLTGISLVDISGFKGSSGDDYMTGEAVYHSSTSSWSGIAMWGYGGDDQMIGSDLNDTMDGGDGDDLLYGYLGNDTLKGGAGNDFFWFENNGGVDTVTDFAIGSDKIVVGTSISSINLYYYGASDALVEFDGGASYAILQNIDPALLSGADFVFA